MDTLPLKDYRILITRGKGQAKRFKDQIEKYGGTPLIVPLLDFQLSSHIEEVKATMNHLSDYDWVILTSQNGVRSFFEWVNKFDVIPSLPKFAVIGTKTAEALERYGHQPDFIPKEFVAEKFCEEFIPQLTRNSKVLLAKGNLARTVISSAFKEAGIICDEVVIYETVLPKASVPLLIDLLQKQEVDVVTFTSSSTVDHFMEIVEQYELQSYVESLIIACIGPIAKQTAVKHGLKVDICPDVYTTEALLEKIITYRKNKGGAPQ